MESLEEKIALPSNVNAYGWTPFVIVILISFIFSYLYFRQLWPRTENNKYSASTATIGMTVALLVALLLPVDVFLVSYMKNPDGSYKEWATNATRAAVEDSVTYTYYAIYSIIFLYLFFIFPLVYFYSEERRVFCCFTVNMLPRALLCAVTCILVFTALLIAGLLIPFKAPPNPNSTDWNKINFLIYELSKNRGKDAVSFVIHLLTTYGVMNLMIYTSAGLTSFPISVMRGARSQKQMEQILRENQTTVQSRINALRQKQSKRILSSIEITYLASLEEEESLISQRSHLLEEEKFSIWSKVHPLTKFINIMLAMIGFTFSVFLWLSLLVGNIDKLMHSLGSSMGFVLKKNVFSNPLDNIMVEAEKLFPLDYIIFFGITIYLVICTISGMQHRGLNCLSTRVYTVQPRRTVPQSLLMASFILMFCALAFPILMFAVIPTYATFGSQSYCVTYNSTACEVHQCSLDAPADDCVMTRSAMFLLRFAYKAWVFSCVYFAFSWGFLASFVLYLFFNMIGPKRSALEEAIDNDDFGDTDDELIRA